MLRIFTISCNRPDFIQLQLNSFRKNLLDEFEFTVFNNATKREEKESIDRMCHALNIRSVEVRYDGDVLQQGNQTVFAHGGEYYNANVANAYPLAWGWKHFISQQGPICLLHSDVFLTKPIKLTDFIDRYDLCYVPQGVPGLEYMWPAFVLADTRRLPDVGAVNWWCGNIRGTAVDVGGQTNQYLEGHPDLNILRMQPSYVDFDLNVDFEPADYEILWLENNPSVLHYRSVSNWNYRSEEYHRKKTEWLKRQI